MSFVGFGGFNMANQAAILQQQANDLRQAQSILGSIGYVPQGGPENTHGNLKKALNLNDAKIFNSFRGLGVDLNGNGKFDVGTDGHLALDLDGNGVYDQNDVRDTATMLKLFSGQDTKKAGGLSGFGGFNQASQAKMMMLKARGKQADLNKDGVLSSWELAKMGGKLIVDANKKAGTKSYVRELPGAQPPKPQYGGYGGFGGLGGGLGGGFGAYPMMSYGPPAFFFQVMANMMYYVPR